MPKLAALILFLAVLTQIAYSEEKLLGVSAPLSGGGAGWGNDVRNVLIFANEKLAGGTYSFVFEDDRCDPKTALSAAEKLSKVDKVKEVFVVCGQSTMATASVYKRAGVTVMAPLATPSRISELGIFRTGLSDAFAAKKLASYIRARHQAVHVLTEENDYPVGFFNDFQSYAQRSGLSVQNENFEPTQHDFRAQLLRLKAKKIEALFLNTQTEQALALLLRQMKEAGMAPTLYGAYLPGSALFLQLAGSLADGIVFVDFPGAFELLTEEGKRLYSEYLARFGQLQGWSFAFPATFEAFRAIHMAKSSGESPRSFLAKAAFEGIFGRYSFNENGDVVGPQHVMRVIKSGKSELLEEAATP